MKRAEVKKMLKAMITLVGPDAFQECVEEYLSQKGDTRVNLLRCNAMMTEEEMDAFIDKVARHELHQELEQMYIAQRACSDSPVKWGYPRYLKAVRASLVALGYDEDWVNGPFRMVLERKYLRRPKQKVGVLVD